jgi:predicted regulator of Ras-like GTPase activity (Roadblock/LC7/MglB family)
MGSLRQAILETEQGVLVMLSVDVGVLVVLSQDYANLDLAQLLMAINAS